MPVEAANVRRIYTATLEIRHQRLAVRVYTHRTENGDIRAETRELHGTVSGVSAKAEFVLADARAAIVNWPFVDAQVLIDVESADYQQALCG